MEILLTFIRVVFFVLSCFGWIDYLTHEKKIKAEFSVFVFLNIVGSVMFLAGILNLLKLTSFSLSCIGIGLCIKAIVEKRKMNYYFTPGTTGLLCFLCLSFVLLYGTKLINYDNFSHWAVVTKELLINDRFPNFQDTNIMFQSYPPGSAAYIYYISKVTGITSEWIMMWAQSTWILGNLSVLYVLAKRKIWNNLLVTIAIVFVLCSNVRLSDIYVDTLLMTVAAGGMVFCIYYQNAMQKMWLYLVPVLINLVGIKNSGLFFASVIIFYIIIFDKNIRYNWKRVIVLGVVPFLTLILWQSHVKMVFERGMSSKHSMSLENLQNIWQEKNGNVVAMIAKAFLQEVFSWRNGIIYLLLGALLINFLYRLMKQKNYIKFKEISFVIGIYVIYLGFLFAMYLFSMPTEEAIRVAAFERYHRTIIDFLFIISIPCILKIGVRKLFVIIPIFSIGLGWFVVQPHIEYLTRVDWKDSKRYEYEQIIEKNKLPNKSSYIFLQKEQDLGYAYYFFRYYFSTTEVAVFNEKQLIEQFEDIIVQWRNYDYLVILDETAGSRRFVEEVTGVNSKEHVINLQKYKMD